jgi:ribonuclease HII
MSGVHLRLERARPGPVCGVDEAGRGPWAGPVCAAAVILPPKGRIDDLDDSKRLTALQREAAEVRIKAEAVAWAVAFASVEEIGELNILHATGLAMRRAVEALSIAPAHVLVDGDKGFTFACLSEPVIGGDAISASIAAASILAKTARDRLMVAHDADYPGYGFADNKGYGVPAHAVALRALGPCPIHRMTWAPLRALVEA